MKPDWSKAPAWANFIAMDKNGQWYWYETEPERQVTCWWQDDGRCEFAGAIIHWENSVESRND